MDRTVIITQFVFGRLILALLVLLSRVPLYDHDDHSVVGSGLG